MRRIQEYWNCPECGNASLAVLKNGRLVRHEPGLGSVFPKEWYRKHPGFRQTICKGSGLKVREPVGYWCGGCGTRFATYKKFIEHDKASHGGLGGP